MAKKVAKTNAVRLIEQQKIAHQLFEYETDNGEAVDGITVATKIGQPVEHVYKTLIATAGKGHYYVFVIPVAAELNLKAAAKAVGEKKVELIAVKELLGLTGYVRGGCSPVGMKKLFPTFIDASAEALDFIIVSAGKIGMQMKLKPTDIAHISQAAFAEITV
ncbi:Cys-tRNA(Pro) deacylase [Solibacillus sp. FSL H8-0538]|uniref:Cys-tRNA(Pro) deacylase n=1 Tax=Solibacillus sp. FSL H8-0538 TaxID=2921400 RepID=UPI0030FCD76D